MDPNPNFKDGRTGMARSNFTRTRVSQRHPGAHNFPPALHVSVPCLLPDTLPVPASGEQRGHVRRGGGRQRVQVQTLAVDVPGHSVCVHRRRASLAHVHRQQRGAPALSQELLHQVAQLLAHPRPVESRVFLLQPRSIFPDPVCLPVHRV